MGKYMKIDVDLFGTNFDKKSNSIQDMFNSRILAAKLSFVDEKSLLRQEVILNGYQLDELVSKINNIKKCLEGTGLVLKV